MVAPCLSLNALFEVPIIVPLVIIFEKNIFQCGLHLLQYNVKLFTGFFTHNYQELHSL